MEQLTRVQEDLTSAAPIGVGVPGSRIRQLYLGQDPVTKEGRRTYTTWRRHSVVRTAFHSAVLSAPK